MRYYHLAALAILFTSCVSPRWVRYDDSQYRVAMEPGVESYQAHVDFLIDWSESKDGLPPGLAAEVGFYLGLLGKASDAAAWFDLELAAHPESAQFIEALRAISGPWESPEEINTEEEGS